MVDKIWPILAMCLCKRPITVKFCPTKKDKILISGKRTENLYFAIFVHIRHCAVQHGWRWIYWVLSMKSILMMMMMLKKCERGSGSSMDETWRRLTLHQTNNHIVGRRLWHPLIILFINIKSNKQSYSREKTVTPSDNIIYQH